MTGRRNVSRPPELAASVFWITGSAWLFYFPFNFVHFAGSVPDLLRFLLSWITNDIAKVLFIFGTLGGVVLTVMNPVLY
jgi:hypothetical protein